MGKFKNLLIQCLDNEEDPVYTLRKLNMLHTAQSYRKKKDEQEKEIKEKKSVGERTLDKPFV